MSRYYSVLVITVVVINGLHCNRCKTHLTLWGPVENPEPSRVMSFKSEAEQGMALRRERGTDRQIKN